LAIFTKSCSTAEIRERIDLPFKDISALPKGFVFERLSGTPDDFSSIYVNKEQNTMLILEQKMLTGDTISPVEQVGLSAQIEQVTIGALPGEYVRGGFIYSDNENWIQWDNTRVTQNLVWVENGVMYRLTYNGEALTKELLIDFGKSLSSDVNHERQSTELVQAELNQDPMFNLSIPEAEAILGYTLSVPESWLLKIKPYFRQKPYQSCL